MNGMEMVLETAPMFARVQVFPLIVHPTIPEKSGTQLELRGVAVKVTCEFAATLPEFEQVDPDEMVHAILPEEMLFAPVIPPVLLAVNVRVMGGGLTVTVVVEDVVTSNESSVAFAVREYVPAGTPVQE